MSKKPIPAAALWAEPPIPTRIQLLNRECGKEPAQIPNNPAGFGDFFQNSTGISWRERGRELPPAPAPLEKRGFLFPSFGSSQILQETRQNLFFRGGSDLIPDIPGIPGTPRAAEIFTFPNFSVPKRSHFFFYFFFPRISFSSGRILQAGIGKTASDPRDLGWKSGAGISGIRIPTPEGSVLPSPGCGGNEKCFGIAPKTRNKRESRSFLFPFSKRVRR